MSNPLILQYKGFVSQKLFNSENVKTSGGSPPPPSINNELLGISINVNPYNQIITWNGDVPEYLSNKTVNTLNEPSSGINGSVFLNAVFTVEEGTTQFTCDGGQPVIQVYLYKGIESTPYTSIRIIRTNASGSPCQTVPYCSSVNGNFTCPSESIVLNPNESLSTVQAIPWNPCFTVKGCLNYDVNNLTLIMTINIILTITCGSGSDLDSGFCQAYCLTQDETNLENCLPLYLDYCFAGNGVPDKIQTDLTCREFISEYIKNVNPNPQIDAKLTEYCTKTYPNGFKQLFENPVVPTDPTVCACHMQMAEYTAFENQLLNDYTGINVSTTDGINDRCLLPQCASSAFTTTSIGKICNVPQCLTITSFKVNGSFDNSKVIINVNTPGCENIKNKNNETTPASGSGSGTGSGTGSSLDKNKWWFIGGAIAIVLIFIIILIIVLIN